jgi:hypothetical protein
VPSYLRLAIPRYVYGPANLVGCPECVIFQGRCALVALPVYSGHHGFCVRNEGLPVGCAPDGPAKCFWVLGRCTLETFLRSACLEWLCQTPHSHAGYLDVSTLHTLKDRHYFISFIIDNLFMQRTFQDPVGYPRILDIIDLRPL